MKSGWAIGVMLALLWVIPVAAQEGGDDCDAQSINATVDELVSVYRAGRATATDAESALAEVERLESALAEFRETCQVAGSGGSDEPGTGRRNDPYAFGGVGDTENGFTLQLTGYIRPGDRIIRNQNRFNDRPKDDEVYVIVSVELDCDDSSSSCEAQIFNFRLVGDRGIIYEVPYVVYDKRLEINVLGGTTAQGDLPFMVKQDDTNLRLMYSPSSFFDEGDEVYYKAEPSLADGIEITAASNVNVRSGPGTNFDVAGNLAANTPVVAFGRNGDGTWLQISDGWVFAELVTVAGNAQTLPVTAE